MVRAGADSGGGQLGPRDIVLLGTGCVVAALLVPELPFVGAPLATLALAWLTYQGRAGIAAGLALLAAAAVAFAAADPLVALIVGPMLLLCGPATAIALESRSALRVALALGVGIAVVWFATLVGEVVASGLGPMRFYADQVAEMTKLMTAVLGSAPQDAETVREAVRMVLELWPSYLVVSAGLTALLSVLSATAVARWTGRQVNALPKLASADLTVHVAWPAIIGLLLLAAAGFRQTDTAWYAVVARNLLFVGRALLFMQGLAVFAGLYERAQFKGPIRTIGFAMLVFTESMIPLVSLTGLADLWMNIRRLPREAGPATEET